VGRIPKNTRSGGQIATVERLGYVPPCVKDAFSWLPHPYGMVGRGKKAKPMWFWEAHLENRRPVPNGNPPPAILAADGQRCHRCVFQEPAWSQNHAMCSHSWLNDHGGECRVFIDRDEFLEVQPGYARFCRPPKLADAPDELMSRPYRPDGTLYSEYRSSCNLPSGYVARLNMPKWYAAAASLYGLVEQERLRRFWQWAREETTKQIGVFQLNMFLDEWEETGQIRRVIGTA
jgi:hypothetical protein